MQPVKYLIVAILAVCAFECRAAQVPYSADKVDVRLFVENGAAIARNMFKAVNTGLDQSKPNMDKILNELAPEAKAYIRNIIDKVRGTINEEDKRITYIFATLNKTLDNLKPIKPCTDKVTGPMKKLALSAEKEIVAAVQGVEKKHKKEIDNVKMGAEKLVKKARTLFDTEVVAIVKCLTPGNKDANKCLNTELDKITKDVLEILVEGVILVDTATESLFPVLTDTMDVMIPLIKKYDTNFRGILKTLADCVGTLKA